MPSSEYCYNWFIHFPINEHLGCLQFCLLLIKLSWTFLSMSFGGHSDLFLGVYPAVDLLYHRVGKCLALGNIVWLFCNEAVPFYAPINSSWEFWLLPGFPGHHRLTACIGKADILILRFQEAGDELESRVTLLMSHWPSHSCHTWLPRCWKRDVVDKSH